MFKLVVIFKLKCNDYFFYICYILANDNDITANIDIIELFTMKPIISLKIMNNFD